MSNCKYCNSILQNSHNKFCNRSCAAKFNNHTRTKESREKQRKTLFNTLGTPYKPLRTKPIDKKYWTVARIASGPYSLVYFNACSHCKNLFCAKKKYHVVCSAECRYERSTLNYVKKQQLKYFNKTENKNVYLHSNWEVIIAKELDHLNVDWLRPNKCFTWYDLAGTKRKYLPDFYLVKYDIYLDVKNPFKHKKEIDKITILITNNKNLFIGDIEYIKQKIYEFEGIT